MVLTRPLDDELLEKLEAAGARVVRLPSGRPAAVGRVVSILIEPPRIEELAALPEVIRIDPTRSPFHRLPLNKTAALVGAPAAWNAPAPHPGFTGEGVVVADLEDSWDIFHPDFFRADGGGYDFLDVNGDGIAGPGDKVDLDGDGVFESELRLLSFYQVNYYAGEVTDPGVKYTPDVDWLYVDTNGNGKRDFGTGFTDDDPAFGEPIFIGDDLNRSGAIEVGERLLRLGTSKVRSIHQPNGKVHRRGQNLSTYRHSLDPTWTDHGTGATGIAAGGWPGVNRRYVGMAPGADLVLIGYGPTMYATALEENVDVLFVELSFLNDFHDGSGPMSEGLTALAETGMTVVTPTGNVGGQRRTARIRPRADEPERIRFRTQPSGGRLRENMLMITWIGPDTGVEFFLIDGESKLRLTGGTRSFSGLQVTNMQDRSSRGTSMQILRLTPTTGGVLPSKELALELVAQQGIEEIRFQTVDEGGWGPGAWFLDHVDEEITAIAPSTADGVIGVGAYVGRRTSGYGGNNGEVATYSGKGARIDGQRVVHLVAPDDPFAPSWAPEIGEYYATFGGTSGALPHVAGAAALLKEAFPQFQHDEIKEALQAGARTDSFTGETPNLIAGSGKVDVARALFGDLPEDRGSLTLRLELSAPAVAGRETTVRAIVETDEGETTDAVVEFDVGWDGLYEVSRSSVREVALEIGEGRLPVVARAFDAVGRTSRAVLWVEAATDCEETGCSEGCCLDDGSCGSCDDHPGQKPDPEVRKKRKSSGGCSAAGGDSLPWLLLPAAALATGLRSRFGAGRGG